MPTWQEWSAEQAKNGKAVAVDPTLLTSGTAKKLSEKIKKSGGKELRATVENLVDLVWDSDKPPRPNEPVIILDEKFAGKDVKTKLEDLRKELEKKKSLGFVVSMLDEIAWLFNLRGNDIPYNPVFFSYAIVTPDEATLYIDSSKLSPDCQAFLEKNKVLIKPYQDIFPDATTLSKTAKANKTEASDSKKFLISNRASWALKRALGGDDFVEEARSPLVDAKAVKNETELEGMRACHIRDGAALIEYFAWLEDQLIAKKASIDEVDAADKLEAYRAKHKDFVGLSFDTISSTGPKWVPTSTHPLQSFY